MLATVCGGLPVAVSYMASLLEQVQDSRMRRARWTSFAGVVAGLPLVLSLISALVGSFFGQAAVILFTVGGAFLILLVVIFVALILKGLWDLWVREVRP